MRAHFDAVFFSLVVVSQGDQSLLVKEPDGFCGAFWYLSAGGVKAGEDFLAATVHETHEEAGIIKPDDLLEADPHSPECYTAQRSPGARRHHDYRLCEPGVVRVRLRVPTGSYRWWAHLSTRGAARWIHDRATAVRHKSLCLPDKNRGSGGQHHRHKPDRPAG